MSIGDTFPQAYFNGVPFPVERSRILFAIRDHVFEFPHTSGGAPEKLGRRLYQFQVSANFDERFTSYPGLYPQGLDTLQGYAEQQTTGGFRLPQMTQEVQAYIVTMDREWNNRIRSGERVEIVFREDQSSQFLFEDLVSIQTGSLQQGVTFTNQELENLKQALTLSNNTQNLFDALQSTVANVLALRDQAELYGNRLQAQVAQVISLCAQLDTVSEMQLVPAWPVVNALHDLWAASVTFQNDILSQGAQIQIFTNPMDQDIGRVAMAIYKGDSSRVQDLLSLNDIPDPILVRAGQPIRYYP